MDVSEVRKLPQTRERGIVELTQVPTSSGFRRGTDGVAREIAIDLLDAAPDAGARRHAVEVSKVPSDDAA
ncbi:MAG: hypothetical protein QOF51_1208 [Chloroflexota bacterium]|jgi:hypothetical protein|nr:hypothetical protein [Chloroflexota bacterium]